MNKRLLKRNTKYRLLVFVSQDAKQIVIGKTKKGSKLPTYKRVPADFDFQGNRKLIKVLVKTIRETDTIVYITERLIGE